jgi:cytochrome c-type biogenesis protein CcmF
MIPELGRVAVLTAFVAAIYSTTAAFYGARRKNSQWVESARNATVATFPLIALACITLIISLLRGDFSLDYVWRVSSREMPTYLKVTALWGGQAGSLLFWNLLLAAFTAAAMLRKWDEQREIMPYALAVASITQIFFLALTAFVENPFARLPAVQADGNGLNPLLRHPGMIIHPPMLYLGFTGFTIPYAFAMGALITGKLDDGWIKTTRRWTLTAWLFLSLGLILGGRWAYDVLGWGGYWAWDPVENASFLPWLAGTAFLHSVMIQEKRNMFKTWNISLIILTYCLVIVGTFIVRSGVISSVHAFARSAIGPLFFGFIGVMLIFSLYWLLKRQDILRTENHLQSLLSREAAFLYNNFVILAILLVTFVGTIFPILSELATEMAVKYPAVFSWLNAGGKVTVAQPYYNQVNGPLFAVLLILMGVAPLTMWFRTSIERLGKMTLWPAVVSLVATVALFFLNVRSVGALIGLWIVIFAGLLTLLEFWRGTQARMRSKDENLWAALSTLIGRNRRRYGGYWIHLGVVVMAFGIIGSTFFQQETQIRLQRGQSAGLGSYTMTFDGVEQRPGADDLIITEATLSVFNNGNFVTTLYPRTEFYTRTGQPMTIPDLRATISEDFYVLLINWEQTSADAATFRIYLNPLINWVWSGGIVFVIGTLIAMWPEPAVETAWRTTPARARRPRPAELGTETGKPAVGD